MLERAYDGWLVPVLGFLLLPWTMLAYAWMYDAGPGLEVEGFEWILVGLAVLIDLGSLFGGGAQPQRLADALAQHELLDLARARLGQLVDDLDPLGDLEARRAARGRTPAAPPARGSRRPPP